jgi:hypothetical protein
MLFPAAGRVLVTPVSFTLWRAMVVRIQAGSPPG